MRRLLWAVALCVLSVSAQGQTCSTPNKPATYTTVIDESFDSLDVGGVPRLRVPATLNFWAYTPGWITGTTSIRDTDAGASCTPSYTHSMLFPVGTVGSAGGGGASASIRDSVSNLYLATWFKLSPNFQGHNSGQNKILLLGTNQFTDSYTNVFLTWRSDSVYRVELQGVSSGCYVARQLTPNVDTRKWPPGAWRRLEMLLRGNTPGTGDGRAQLWVDGVLVLDYADVCYRDAQRTRWIGMNLDPVWGGGGDVITTASAMSFDQLYVATGNPTGAGALDSTFRADTVTSSTISDSLIVRYLSTTFGKRTITYPDTIYVALHSRAPTRLGVGGILDTTWADTTGTGAGASARRAKNILRIPNVGGWSSVVTSGTNRGCVTNQVKFGVGDTVKFFGRVWRWVSVWADSGLTKPMGVVKLALPVTARTGKQPSILPGALAVCSGY